MSLSGTVDRIEASNTPPQRVAPAHVAFSWTDGAAEPAASQAPVVVTAIGHGNWPLTTLNFIGIRATAQLTAPSVVFATSQYSLRSTLAGEAPGFASTSCAIASRGAIVPAG